MEPAGYDPATHHSEDSDRAESRDSSEWQGQSSHSPHMSVALELALTPSLWLEVSPQRDSSESRTFGSASLSRSYQNRVQDMDLLRSPFPALLLSTVVTREWISQDLLLIESHSKAQC